MAKRKSKKKKTAKKRGKGRYRMSLAARKRASRRMKAMWRKGVFKKGKKGRKKGRKGRKKTRASAKARYAKSALAAYNRMKAALRRGISPPPGVVYSAGQIANLARLRAKKAQMAAESARAREYEGLFAAQDQERAEQERIAQSMRAAMSAGRYATA